MKDGTCPKCGSRNIYKSTNNSWSSDGIAVRVIGEKVNEVFGTEAYLCVEYRQARRCNAKFGNE